MKASKEIKELIYTNHFLSMSGLISFYCFPQQKLPFGQEDI